MSRITAIAALLVAVVTSGCVTIHQEPASLAELNANSVILVGRVELVPPLSPEEQQIDMGLDPLDTKNYHVGRAIMFLSDRPVYQERTENVINPPLEQTWFVSVPRHQRYMIRGSVTMDFAHRAVDRHTVAVDQTELLMPAPVEFDMQAGDRAVYIGTLRLHRDEFHSVTKAEIVDDYRSAMAEYRKRYGSDAPLRKALARPVIDSAALNRQQ